MNRKTAAELQAVRTKIESLVKEVRDIHDNIDEEAIEESTKAGNLRENFPDKASTHDDIADCLNEAVYDLNEAAEHLESASENINEACEVEQ